ncbi:hypothetical protein F4818DRAFT_453011 [Hypoxylon cercidicola]|nr:hypothetical protein F4818DRAFT_453011 [Hypoxylon cercidicola]
MKFSTSVYLAALQWQISYAAATPLGEYTTDVGYPAEKRVFNIKVDCNELINQVLSGVQNYPFFASQVVAVGKNLALPSATAYSVCKTFKTEVIDCKYASLSVATSIGLAMTHGFIETNPPKEGTTEAKPNKHHREILDSTGDYLRSRGVEFESISVQPLVGRREDDGSVDSGHFVEVRGVREPGQDSKTGYHIYSRSDGSGSIRAIPDTEDHLGRRSDGAGYKTSWQVSSRTGSPPAPARQGLASVLANDWESRVESDHSIGDYIGLSDFGSIGRIQIRIIPESGAFGTNFEAVDRCSK